MWGAQLPTIGYIYSNFQICNFAGVGGVAPTKNANSEYVKQMAAFDP